MTIIIIIIFFFQATRRLRERDASQSDSVAMASADDDEENPDDSEGENRKFDSVGYWNPLRKHAESKVSTASATVFALSAGDEQIRNK